ncbi:hypothetical protein RB601_004355 [Gaeumannomyces tritici]
MFSVLRRRGAASLPRAKTTSRGSAAVPSSLSCLCRNPLLDGWRPLPASASRLASTSTSDNKQTDSQASASDASSQSTRSLVNEQTLDWEDKVDYQHVDKFSDLPYRHLGYNQHMIINAEFKKALGDIVKYFQAPIIYAFAYGSGVFPQSKLLGRTPSDELVHSVHPDPDPAIVRAQGEKPKMIDFIFGVSHTQHWHSLNIRQNRHHYSGLASLGSGLVSRVQDRYGAGVYFNPYVQVEGVLVKYGVVNIDTLCRDLLEWDTLYLAGRLHKPVKIIRDNARVRIANQTNLLAAIRTALLMLPEEFTERELYSTIAGLSYLGDPRMRFPTENPRKVANIVGHNAIHFRNLYAPLVQVLPNVDFAEVEDPSSAPPEHDLVLRQTMSDATRGNMVRRLPRQFRSRVYFEYQKKWQISRADFDHMTENLQTEEGGISFGARTGGEFDQRIAKGNAAVRREILREAIEKTTSWPSTVQAIKGVAMSGVSRSMRYLGEKMDKYREGKKQGPPEHSGDANPDDDAGGRKIEGGSSAEAFIPKANEKTNSSDDKPKAP